MWLPYAIAEKYPSAGREWGWQYVFPSGRLSVDPSRGRLEDSTQGNIAAVQARSIPSSALSGTSDLPHSPSRFVTLRKDVERFLKDSEGRKTTRRELAIQDRRVPGKVHEFHEGGEIDYIFERSDQVPFSFISMDLKYGQVHLFATLDSSLAVAPEIPVSFDTSAWEKRAQDTQALIVKWQTDHPNYRFWTVTTMADGTEKEERLLAEWAGERTP